MTEFSFLSEFYSFKWCQSQNESHLVCLCYLTNNIMATNSWKEGINSWPLYFFTHIMCMKPWYCTFIYFYTKHACLLPQHLIIICAAPLFVSICHSLLFLMSRCRCVHVHYYHLPSLHCWAVLMREILTLYASAFLMNSHWRVCNVMSSNCCKVALLAK